MTNDEPVVVLEKRKNYWIIKLNRPQRKNAFIRETYSLITQFLKQAEVDDLVRFIIFTGVGDYFTSGADLAGRAKVKHETFDRGNMATFRLFVEALILFRKPIIAAVNGPAIGIGATLLGLCDLVLASDTSSFLTPFSRIGIVPEACSSYTFPKIMGSIKVMYHMISMYRFYNLFRSANGHSFRSLVKSASNMLLFNQRMTAQEAKIAGLVSEIFSHKTFWKQVTEKAEKILELPEKSLLYGKALLRASEKEKLLDVNRQECERMIERHSSEDPMKQALKFLQERMKLRQKRKSKL